MVDLNKVAKNTFLGSYLDKITQDIKPKNESLPAIKNYNTERKLTSRKLTINPETSPPKKLISNS